MPTNEEIALDHAIAHTVLELEDLQAAIASGLDVSAYNAVSAAIAGQTSALALSALNDPDSVTDSTLARYMGRRYGTFNWTSDTPNTVWMFREKVDVMGERYDLGPQRPGSIPTRDYEDSPPPPGIGNPN